MPQPTLLRERRKTLAVWGLLLGMISLINITMLAAVMQVAGSIPDDSMLRILSRYLKGREEPPDAPLHPQEAAARLGRLRKRILAAGAVAALAGAALAIWAAVAGWGVVAVMAITGWTAAFNLVIISAALSSWRKRANRM